MELVHNSALYSTTYFLLLPQSLHVLYNEIKAMLRGILVIRFGNTISLLIPSKRNNDFIFAKCTVRVSTSFMSLLLAVSTPTVATAIQKSNNDHFHPQFPIFCRPE